MLHEASQHQGSSSLAKDHLLGKFSSSMLYGQRQVGVSINAIGESASSGSGHLATTAALGKGRHRVKYYKYLTDGESFGHKAVTVAWFGSVVTCHGRVAQISRNTLMVELALHAPARDLAVN